MFKILIFGLPRTATTAIQLELTRQFSIESFSEPFCGDKIADDVHNWAASQQNCVMKLLTTNLCQLSTEKIDPIRLCKQGFTHIIVTQRSSLVDCCVSLYYAERVTNKYHYKKQTPVDYIQFSVDENFVKFWLTEVGVYYQVLADLEKNHIRFELFDYDLYVRGDTQYIGGRPITYNGMINYVHPGIDYPALCSNYQEVKLLIEDYVKRIQH